MKVCLLDGAGDGFATISGDGRHRAGVTETEVDDSRPVHVVEVRAFGGFPKIGNAPAHFFIQFIGTPPRRRLARA